MRRCGAYNHPARSTGTARESARPLGARVPSVKSQRFTQPRAEDQNTASWTPGCYRCAARYKPLRLLVARDLAL